MANLTPQEIQHKTYLEYRIANKLATPEERMQYQDIVNKEKGITGTKEPTNKAPEAKPVKTNTTAEYYANQGSKASATPSVSRNAPVNASAVRNAQQKVAAQNDTAPAAAYNRSKEEAAKGEQIKQQEQKKQADAQKNINNYNNFKQQVQSYADAAAQPNQSQFDVMLAQWNQAYTEYKWYINNGNTKAAEDAKQRMNSIAKQAQTAGIYNYAEDSGAGTKASSVYAPLLFDDFDSYSKALRVSESRNASPDAVGDHTVSARMWDTNASKVAEYTDSLTGHDIDGTGYFFNAPGGLESKPDVAAKAVLQKLQEDALIAEKFNEAFDLYQLPEDYDFSDSSKPINNQLQKLSRDAEAAESDVEAVIAGVRKAFKINGEDWKNAFIYAFYSMVENYLSITPEDREYAKRMVEKYSDSRHMLQYDEGKPMAGADAAEIARTKILGGYDGN